MVVLVFRFVCMARASSTGPHHFAQQYLRFGCWIQDSRGMTLQSAGTLVFFLNLRVNLFQKFLRAARRALRRSRQRV